jgi:hypothetical protein
MRGCPLVQGAGLICVDAGLRTLEALRLAVVCAGMILIDFGLRIDPLQMVVFLVSFRNLN